MNKNRIRGIRCQASGHVIAKPISIKSTGCKSGGCAKKGVRFYLGRSAIGSGIGTESRVIGPDQMENGLVNPVDEGTPQGGPLSPLLSNIVLDEMDRELDKRGLRFVRYADDRNIYVRSCRAGERVMASITLNPAVGLRVESGKC